MSDSYTIKPKADPNAATVAAEAAYKRTVARLAVITKQFTGGPCGTKLKGKVAIITGVGSLKGIGYVF